MKEEVALFPGLGVVMWVGGGEQGGCFGRVLVGVLGWWVGRTWQGWFLSDFRFKFG